MTGSYRKAKTELLAIYRLQFYRKQKHWKLSGDKRRQKEAEKQEEKERTKHSLNMTYSVTQSEPEEEPSVLNEAFCDDGKGDCEVLTNTPEEEPPGSAEAGAGPRPPAHAPDHHPYILQTWKECGAGESLVGGGQCGAESRPPSPPPTAGSDEADGFQYAGRAWAEAEEEAEVETEAEAEANESARWTRRAHCNPHSTELDLSEWVEWAAADAEGLARAPGAALERRAAALRRALRRLRAELRRRRHLRARYHQRMVQERCGAEEPTRDVGLQWERWDPFLAGSHAQRPDRGLSSSSSSSSSFSSSSSPSPPPGPFAPIGPVSEFHHLVENPAPMPGLPDFQRPSIRRDPAQLEPLGATADAIEAAGIDPAGPHRGFSAGIGARENLLGTRRSSELPRFDEMTSPMDDFSVRPDFSHLQPQDWRRLAERLELSLTKNNLNVTCEVDFPMQIDNCSIPKLNPTPGQRDIQMGQRNSLFGTAQQQNQILMQQSPHIGQQNSLFGNTAQQNQQMQQRARIGQQNSFFTNTPQLNQTLMQQNTQNGRQNSYFVSTPQQNQLLQYSSQMWQQNSLFCSTIKQKISLQQQSPPPISQNSLSQQNATQKLPNCTIKPTNPGHTDCALAQMSAVIEPMAIGPLGIALGLDRPFVMTPLYAPSGRGRGRLGPRDGIQDNRGPGRC